MGGLARPGPGIGHRPQPAGPDFPPSESPTPGGLRWPLGPTRPGPLTRTQVRARRGAARRRRRGRGGRAARGRRRAAARARPGPAGRAAPWRRPAPALGPAACRAGAHGGRARGMGRRPGGGPRLRTTTRARLRGGDVVRRRGGRGCKSRWAGALGRWVRADALRARGSGRPRVAGRRGRTRGPPLVAVAAARVGW
jgi:hypothetical protein